MTPPPAPTRPPVAMRWRLVIAFLLFAFATTFVFLHGMREVVHAGWHAYARPMVAGYVDMMTAEIGTPPDPARAAALARRMPVVIQIDGPRVHWASPNSPAHVLRFGRAAPNGEDDAPWMIERRLADGHVLHFGLAKEPPPQHEPGILVPTLGALLVLMLAAYLYVRWLFRPLEDIREGAVRFGRGELSHRIPVTRRDELGDLARRINTMAGEIDGMLDAKRALLMAISHELRSPLTRARVNAELVEEGAARDGLLRDLGQMRDLIDDLLESERLQAGHAKLLREPTDVGALAADVLQKHFPGRAVSLEVAPGQAPVSVDPMRVRLLLRNLVDNALRHGGSGTPPVVRVEPAVAADTADVPGPGPGPRPAGVRLVVRDFGPGVPPDVLPHLSEAFFRADPARQRATGGVGLGLTLCRLVVQAHGGTWHLQDAGPGLAVDVTLPSP